MFESITGQENAVKTISLMLKSGRIPHTLLFAGPGGVGKGETALEFARMLLCENGADSNCSTCRSCVRASKLEHPDLHVLFPFRAPPEKADRYASWLDELTEQRKRLLESYAPVIYEKGLQIVKVLVSEVHERMQESSFEGGRRVCVVLASDRLNATTANSLLKILEEPPDGVHFILTTERLSSMLPTIVSRSSIVRFRRLKAEEIEKYLENEGIGVPAKRHSIARASEGSLKNAKSIALSDTLDIRSRAFEIFTSVALGKYDDVVSNAFPFLRTRDAVATEELINGFVWCTRSVLETKTGLKTEPGEFTETLERLSRLTDVPSLHRLSTGLEKSLDMLGRNVNISMVITALYYEIHDTFRKGQHRQKHYSL